MSGLNSFKFCRSFAPDMMFDKVNTKKSLSEADRFDMII